MKITIIMPNPSMTGGDRVCAIYAKKLIQKGHTVNVISPKKNFLTFYQQLKRLAKGKQWLSMSAQRQNHFELLGINVIYNDTFNKVNEQDVPDADAVIATWWETAEWIASLSSKKGVKIHFIQHHEIFPWLPIERVKKVYQLPCHKIVISKWLLDVMQNQYQASNISLIKNSVDTSLFNAKSRGRQIQPTLGFIFSETGFKGTDIALKVIQQLKQQIPNLRVLSFGSHTPSLKYQLPSYVEFKHSPRQEYLREIYGQCDVWLCCSQSEGFNLPALEAMACRCPVVSTKCGGPEDFISHGINGLLCRVDDVGELASAVMHILDISESAWLEMSNAAFDTANSYSWDDATELFEQALQHAVTSQN